LVTPPYDVISPEAQARYYTRHPENIIRLELGRDEPGDDALNNRYTRAAIAFAEWRLRGVLQQDAPTFYLYEQRFTSDAHEHTRTTLLARVRLEPWEAGVVLPHERTLSKPKDDRLQLLRACAANLSPILALYDDPKGELAKRLARVRRAKPAISFTDEAGEEHRLWPTADALLASQVAAFFNGRQLYIADGHHRYETALAYRDEIREQRRELLADDAVNFVLMALTALEDPGLAVLPTHRVVHDVPSERLVDLEAALEPWFQLEPLEEAGGPAGWMSSLAAAQRKDSATAAFVLVRPGRATLLRLRPEGRAAMRTTGVGKRGADEPAPADGGQRSDAWRLLDVAILHELVLERALGIGAAAVQADERVTFTRDAAAAARAVQDERGALALLLNATPPAAVRDVARVGDRMPQKSTYFYPKLITGLVLNPLW
jgi:uncharacterized protein (DUF1015 family)